VLLPVTLFVLSHVLYLFSRYLALVGGILDLEVFFYLCHDNGNSFTSNFKFGMQLGLAKAHHKNHNQRKKWAWPWAIEAAKYLGFRFNISATAALSS